MSNARRWATNAMKELAEKRPKKGKNEPEAPAPEAPEPIKMGNLLGAGGIYGGLDYRHGGPAAPIRFVGRADTHLPDETIYGTVFYIVNPSGGYIPAQLSLISRSTNATIEDTYVFNLLHHSTAVTRGSSFQKLIDSGRVFTEQPTAYSYQPQFIKLSELLQAGGIYGGVDYRTMGPAGLLHLFNGNPATHLPDESLNGITFFIRNTDGASFVAAQMIAILRSATVGSEDTFVFRLSNGVEARTRASSFRALIQSGRVFTEQLTQYSHIPAPAAALQPYQQYIPYPAHIAPLPHAALPAPPPQQRVQTHFNVKELKNIMKELKNREPPRGGRSRRNKRSSRRTRSNRR